VIFAGVNLGRGTPARQVEPSKVARYAHRNLGAGGIYLCIEHDPDAIAAREAGGVGVPHKIVSCYMHLATYAVATDEKVTAGQIIGIVGRTGVKVSPPHLHLEIRVNDRFTNPARYLTDMVIPPKATMTYRYVMKAKRARLRV
jgi:murein DD-endopeptidase MepM/ murein hydrolase activator NlpD